MLKYIFSGLIFILLSTSLFAQKKVIKAQPEKDKKKKVTVVKKKNQQKKPVLRSKLQQPELINSGGVSFAAHDNRYMGFGAHYGRLYGTRMSWSLQFQYFTVPSDQFYFDPYYWQYVSRNRGSMIMLTLSSKILLPVLQNEPNLNPYWVIGAGPVLGIQSDWTRQFPGSFTHAYTIGGFTTYTGPGMSYYLGSWSLNFEIYYQLLRFPKNIFGKDKFDGMMFSVGIGKMF